MSLIDRRQNKKQKTAGSRELLRRRYKGYIKKAVSDAVARRGITDIDKGGSEKINIPGKDMNEPFFHHGKGGKKSNVIPGNNRKYNTGDIVPRPKDGGGKGGPGASDSGEGEDDFIFEISQEEFLNYMFEDLELPNMIAKMLASSEEYTVEQAGTTKKGRPNQINVIRTFKTAISRRIAARGRRNSDIEQLEALIAELKESLRNCNDSELVAMLTRQIEEAEAKIYEIENQKPPTWIDDTDVVFNATEIKPLPVSKAVMFCVMDVSGSMDQRTKDLAKRFFILLYMFLKREYKVIDVVFIRHHTSAKEVDEEEFFYGRETGGTIVSSALKLIKEILEGDRYPKKDWNIYGAQASDGDNWDDDSKACEKIMVESLLPIFQYWAYIEIPHYNHQDLWRAFQRLREQFPSQIGVARVDDYKDIWPVFRELFKKANRV